ncbi:hypothetical protein ERD78_11760 [Allopusillimonas soli]|uniref:Uncharacterized protein n=1 Tax=Allopusillimonas soli TaxID=659016 RepID=A0A853FFU9_9BURK|nr:hypothetical protein [Allopusillimonas soli]NYT37371.1 hypothetical protein [Allopusillimonas soli]TEA74647.1 hypothetical protein ERD78_11760 [Allopusillimonas soli]
MHLFSSATARIADMLARDDSRVTLQTVSAVLVAHGAMHLLPFDTTTWAMFSALFVVQANHNCSPFIALLRCFNPQLSHV